MGLYSVLSGYSLEHYYPLQGADVSSINSEEQGTGGFGSFSKGTDNPVQITNGGPDGEGSWQFSWDSAAEVYFRTFQSWPPTSDIFVPEVTDLDWSWGFWFKINTATISGSYDTSLKLARFGGGIVPTYLIYDPTNKIMFAGGNSSTVLMDAGTADDDQWHYFAETVADNGDGNATVTRYFDGIQVSQNIVAWGTNSVYLELGDNFVTGTEPYLFNYELSHFYIAPTSVIDSQDIADIWVAGITAAPLNISVSSDPFIASADIPAPTLVGTIGNSVYITTNIAVGITFPSPVIYASENINNVIDTSMEASCDIVNNVSVYTGGDFETVPYAMEASAEIKEPLLPVDAMRAIANFPSPILNVDPSYYALVMQNNPVFYYDFATSSVQNYGSWTITGSTVGSTVDRTVVSPQQMYLVDTPNSWQFTGNYNNAPDYVRIDIDNLPQIIDDFKAGGEGFTIEYWYYPQSTQNGVGLKVGNVTFTHMETNKLVVTINDCYPAWSDNFVAPYNIHEYYLLNNNINTNEWNHVVFKTYKQFDENTQQYSDKNSIFLYVNGNLVSGNIELEHGYLNPNYNQLEIYASSGDRIHGYEVGDTPPYGIGYEEGSFSPLALPWPGFALETTEVFEASAIFDQVAIYDFALSDSEIIDHRSFIMSASPDENVYPLPMTAYSLTGNHLFYYVQPVTIYATPLTLSCDIVGPTFTGGISISVISDAMNASALINNAALWLDNNFVVSSITAYASLENATFIDSEYSSFILNTINPYRYVNFDTSNVGFDYGTDNDYSVTSTTINGYVLLPGYGISGKSIETDGISYTNGVILNESEWNDSWGTGTNEYHSSFLVRRSPNDQSTTGLRVLWNLNGHLNNQHVILYQYNNRLYMNFNNGSGTFIESFADNIDLFDYLPHLVSISFDHTGSNNYVYLYVDGQLVLTVNLEQYTGETVNSLTYLSPNDETNNYPRLGIGCLITPFADTSLPVLPTNTKLIVDEIYWALTPMDLTLAYNLYSLVPQPEVTNFSVNVIDVDATIIDSKLSYDWNQSAAVLSASTNIEDPAITVVAHTNINSESMFASATMSGSNFGNSIYFAAEIMFGSASFNGATVKITIPGSTMYATIEILGRDIEIQGYKTFMSVSPWAAYLRATTIESILPMTEVR